MFNRIKAWKELVKLGLNVSQLRKDIDTFFRGNILGVFRNEGWFEYLQTPRTALDIASEFHYTDIEFLEYLLDILVEDGVIKRTPEEKYASESPSLEFDWVYPCCFDEAMRELWVDHAKAIPDRLRGQYISFTGGMNLFNWDDALSNKLYEQIRRAAFAFADALEKPVRFLDIGSGNGRGTAAIWSYYYDKGFFKADSPMSIVGLDPSDRLLKIAREEFSQMVVEYNGNDFGISDIVETYPPEFQKGYAEEIPFEDESFDVVFASQVLHWTSPEPAVKEMMRVVKPGGFVFGTQNLYPHANRFSEAHFKVVEGAGGFFYKEDLQRWATDAGATKISTATPISVFKIEK